MSLEFGLTTRMSRVRRQADAEDGSEATVAGVLSMSESTRNTKNRTMTSATETKQVGIRLVRPFLEPTEEEIKQFFKAYLNL